MPELSCDVRYLVVFVVACGGSTGPATPPPPVASAAPIRASASVSASASAVAVSATREPEPDVAGPFDHAAFSPDGKRLALGGADLVVVDVATRRRVRAAAMDGVVDLRFAADGKLAVLGRKRLSIFVEGRRDPVATIERGQRITRSGHHVFWSADGAHLFADGTVRDASLVASATLSYERREPGFAPESWLVLDGVFSGDTVHGWRTQNGRAALGAWPAAGGAMRPLGLEVRTRHLDVRIVDAAEGDLLLTSIDANAFALTRGSRLVRVVHGDAVAFAGKDRIAVLNSGQVDLSPLARDSPTAVPGSNVTAFAITADRRTIALSMMRELRIAPLP